ncbi:MAG: hypothetical protein PHT12_01945 [Patescibacteria group bacterium]|nr:hypothetical protein [Patescibacteria group bacterium]
MANPQADWEDVIEEGFVPPDVSQMTLADAVQAVADAVNHHVHESAGVRQYLEALPKGADTNCPASPVDQIAQFLGYRRANVDQGDPVLWARFLSELMFPVFAFRRRQIEAALDSREEWADQLAVVWQGNRVAEAMDQLYLAWFRRHVTPYLLLPDTERERLAKLWAKSLPMFDYTVHDPNDECSNRHAWAVAFPDEVWEVQGALLGLLELIKEDSPETATCLDRLVDAYGITEIDQLEAVWVAVDQAWITIPPTEALVPVYGFENYEHPNGVSPEFVLALRVTTEAQAKQIAAYREKAIGLASHPNASEESGTAAEAKLSRFDVGAFFPVTEGGVRLSCTIAGQVMPNRQDILAQGGRVFLSEAANLRQYLNLYRQEIRRHCTAQAAALLEAVITDHGEEGLTTGHEFSHPIGRTAASDQRLGEALSLLEEGKATVGGIIVSRLIDQSPERAREIVAVSTGRVCRFLQQGQLSDASNAPYVRECLVVLTVMLQSGVIVLDAGGLDVDLDPAKLKAFFEGLDAFFGRVLAAYRDGNQEALAQMRREYCGADDRGGLPAIRDIIGWINRPIVK